MDINHIQLNPAALAGLYKDHLVDAGGMPARLAKPVTEITVSVIPTQAPPSKAPSASITSIKSLGSNERKVLLLVNHTEIVFLPDEELKFLTGILAACKLSMADVALVNLAGTDGIGYNELLTQFSSNKVLLFGIEPSSIGLPMSFPAFQLQAFNGTTYHWSPDLSRMENDRTLKAQLWNNLKKLFNI